MRMSSSAHAAQASVAPERPSSIPLPGAASGASTLQGGSGKPRPDAPSPWLVGTERCAAGAALVLFSPALAGVLLTVRFLSGQSPLVAHRRAGLDGEPFWLFKIRTMWDRHSQPSPSHSGGWVEYLENTDLPGPSTF